jgi:hypothetical protein
MVSMIICYASIIFTILMWLLIYVSKKTELSVFTNYFYVFVAWVRSNLVQFYIVLYLPEFLTFLTYFLCHTKLESNCNEIAIVEQCGLIIWTWLTTQSWTSQLIYIYIYISNLIGNLCFFLKVSFNWFFLFIIWTQLS